MASWKRPREGGLEGARDRELVITLPYSSTRLLYRDILAIMAMFTVFIGIDYVHKFEGIRTRGHGY